MIPLSDTDLEAMLFDLESDRVERKESFKGDSPAKVREAVCAFANDLPGYGKPGIVLIGAKDDGSPADLNVTDELLLQLSDIRTDGNIVPPPRSPWRSTSCGAGRWRLSPPGPRIRPRFAIRAVFTFAWARAVASPPPRMSGF